jgi:hypothetical protein
MKEGVHTEGGKPLQKDGLGHIFANQGSHFAEELNKKRKFIPGP